MKFARLFLLLLLLPPAVPRGKTGNASGQGVEPRELEQSIRFHILKGETLRGIEILNQYISTARVYEKKPISQFILGQISRYGIREDVARYPYFTANDAEHIKKSLFYSGLARQITADMTSDEAKLLALLDWTSSHIQSTGRPRTGEAVTPVVREDEIDFPTFPWEIIERGYGLCSRQCWVLATLARSLGLSAGVMYLRREEDLISHHTLTWVILKKRLYLFDPYTGVPILLPDGKGIRPLLFIFLSIPSSFFNLAYNLCSCPQF